MDKTLYDKHSKMSLEQAVEDWSKNVYGKNFVFRPQQKETIVNILYDWFNETSNTILDAPTGSGKSFIAMTVAGVLSDIFNKRGYILISDLSLLAQYERDAEFYLPEWGVIRGKQNYTCIVNNLPFPSGVCQIKNCKSYSAIDSNFPDCAPYCEYLCARRKSIIAPVVVCTYSFWLMHQNMVKKDDESCPFDGRDFVICDEAHNLVDIVQNHFSPRFGSEDLKKFELLVTRMNEDLHTSFDIKLLENYRKEVENANDKEGVYKHLLEYKAYLGKIAAKTEDIRSLISLDAKDSSKGHISVDDRNILRICDFIEDQNTAFHYYLNIIEKIGSDYIIKNDSDASNGVIIFNCLDESYLLRSKFHIHCNKRLYMSATIGNHETFARHIGIGKHSYYKLPTVFDYTSSPIYFVPDYKLSYKEKEYSLPYIIKMVENILKMYANKRGIIQTGSYSISKKLYDSIDSSLRSRLLLYDGSAEKRECIEQFKYSKNKVLVGPSLVEGLSLDDELCRFLIMMKVPYPSLASKYVVAKNNFDPYWYNETTAVSVLQGVGRGVRNDKDWCVTFILDGCFNNILNMTRYMFPEEFINRIQGLSASYLLNIKVDNENNSNK